MSGHPDEHPLLCQNRAISLAFGLLTLERRFAPVPVAGNPLPKILRGVKTSAQPD